MKITLWTDGSYNRHNDKAAYAYVMKLEGLEESVEYSKELVDGKKTNNTAEMIAIMTAIEAASNLFRYIEDAAECDVVLYSDSQYCVEGITNWIKNWKLKNYQGVKNKELWKKFYGLYYRHNFKSLNIYWTRGHSDCVENNRCDELCGYITSTKSPLNALKS